jgi:HD-GYP domain-containing protein (c-di-GMP phosphodiesterase class II)
VYQALISDRPYRKAFNKKKALEIIQEEAGRQFDPNVVKIFLKAVEKDNAQRKR